MDITAFDIEATESSALRQLFITDIRDNLYFLAVNSGNYNQFVVSLFNIRQYLAS